LKHCIVPPINDKWKICLVNARRSDIEYIRSLQIAEFIELTIYAPTETLSSFGIQLKEKSNYDKYLDYISDYPKLMSDKIMKQIYFGMNCRLDDIFSVLDKLAEDDSITEIKFEHIRNYINYENNIYPKDVVLSILFYDRKISEFNRYNKTHPIKYIDSLCAALGDSYAFYSVRKLVNRMVEKKLKYLNGLYSLDNSQTDLALKFIDIHELLYLQLLMQNNSGTNLYVILNLLERRKSNDVGIFYQKILTNQIRNHNTGVW
jgi:hypothetical protein